MPQLTPQWLKNGIRVFNKYYLAHLKSLHATSYMLELRGALVVNKIITNMDKVLQNDLTGVRAVVFSGLDTNLYTLAAILGFESQIPWIPHPMDSITVELHEDDGQYFVKAFYIEKNMSVLTEKEMEIFGCKAPCRYERFKSIMLVYNMQEKIVQILCDRPAQNELLPKCFLSDP